MGRYEQGACIVCLQDGRSLGASSEFSPIFCLHCTAITCTRCAAARCKQRTPRELAALNLKRKQEAAQRLAEPLHKRAERQFGTISLGANSAPPSEEEKLWREQMRQAASAGNLDLNDLSDAASLPTLVKLLAVESLQLEVCRTMADVARASAAEEPGNELTFLSLMMPLLELEANAPAEVASGAASAAEEVLAWAVRSGRGNGDKAASGALHWHNCLACGEPNETHLSDRHPFSWLIVQHPAAAGHGKPQRHEMTTKKEIPPGQRRTQHQAQKHGRGSSRRDTRLMSATTGAFPYNP